MRVLVVDDDPVSCYFLEVALAREGYLVTSAASAGDALRHLYGPQRFECVITDYRMPDASGLELLAWVHEHDPSLATIIFTAEGEKQLVAESLRGGAFDFLDKPTSLELLHATVARAVDNTRQKREAQDSQSSLRELARAQECRLPAQGSLQCDVCFHPRHEVGGDFFMRFQPQPHQSLYLITDVSGHDLQAAYTSIYFQGVVRGMVERGATVDEILTTFNRLLLTEWNQAQGFDGSIPAAEISVAACALLVNEQTGQTAIFTHGMPAPVHWTSDGNARTLGDGGGSPLGWFDEFAAHKEMERINSGTICIWTDGLQELARRAQVSELSLAWALQRARAEGQTLEILQQAEDDILIADLQLPGAAEDSQFRPLLLERYPGNLCAEIDELQDYWERSLRLALPELTDERCHDILLATREALLNGLKHGCQERPDRAATLRVSACVKTQTVRVNITDGGPGHEFNVPAHEAAAASELLDAHRGLILMRCLASRIQFEDRGATVTMEFSETPTTTHSEALPFI